MTDTPSARLRADIVRALDQCPAARVLTFEASRGTWAGLLNDHCPNAHTPLGATIRSIIGGEEFMALSFPATALAWAGLLGLDRQQTEALEPGEKLPPHPTPKHIADSIRWVRRSPRMPENIAGLLESIAKVVETIEVRGPENQFEVKPDPDGLVHFTSITSQEQLREIVKTSWCNGRQAELNSRLPTFGEQCTARGLDPKTTTLAQLIAFAHEQGKAEVIREDNGGRLGYGFRIDLKTWDAMSPEMRAGVSGVFDAMAGLINADFPGTARDLRARAEPPSDPVEAAKAYVAEARAALNWRSPPAGTFAAGVEACAKFVRRHQLPFDLATQHRAALSRVLLEKVAEPS